jgi:hypothetical protein
VVGGGCLSVVGTVVGCGGSDVSTTESVGGADVGAGAELVGRAVVEAATVVGPVDGIVVDLTCGPVVVVVGPAFTANGNGLSGAAIVPSPVDTESRHSALVAAPRIAPTANRP